MKSGLLRNVEQIQEAEAKPVGTRAGTLLLVALGTACIVFVGVTQTRRKAAPAARPIDPLSELVAQAKTGHAQPHPDLAGNDVTFPSLLSDEGRTTTALAAVRVVPGAKNDGKNAENGTEGSGAATGDRATPPPPTDRLAVVPLPAKNIVGSSPVVSRPRDTLTQLAKEASSVTTPPVEEGRAGGYQLQTSSFRDEQEAGLFATALRRRGHRAYVETATIAGRGNWYRVRVGPFRSKAEAAAYRAEFEKKEHLVPFLIEPAKDKAPPKTVEAQPAKAQ
jgi:cell division septation protein DedD